MASGIPAAPGSNTTPAPLDTVSGAPKLGEYPGWNCEKSGQVKTSKSFRIVTIDIQSVQNGKICKTYHMENWFAALRQLRAE
jgi:hypothetical protein